MRDILFRGFTPDENGRDTAFVNGEWIKGQWVQGSYLKLNKTTYCFKEDYERDPGNTEHYIVFDQMTDWGLPNRHLKADVLPETVGQFTGLTDKNRKKIFEGDVVFDTIDRENASIIFDFGSYYVKNDNMHIRLGASTSMQVEVIGNIYGSPELLRGEEENA